MDRSTGRSEKMLTIGTILRKFENGEKFFPGKSIFEFDGKMFIDKVKNHKDWSDAQKIAVIAVAKATVFGTGGSRSIMNIDHIFTGGILRTSDHLRDIHTKVLYI